MVGELVRLPLKKVALHHRQEVHTYGGKGFRQTRPSWIWQNRIFAVLCRRTEIGNLSQQEGIGFSYDVFSCILKSDAYSGATLIYSFDEFQLDGDNFCLLRDGKRVPAEPKALRVLLLLVAAEGKLLEKKTLLDEVWKDTFVAESSLTRIIAMLRKQLGDDPQSPRFIETVPTLGYRFIAPVRILEATKAAPPPDPQLVESQNVADPVTQQPSASPDHSDSKSPLPTVQKRGVSFRAVLGGVVALVVIGFAAILPFAGRRRPTLGEMDSILLANFANKSGDPQFDEVVRQGILVQLEQSPLLRLIGETQTRKTLRLMGRNPDEPLSEEVSQEVCQRIGGTVVLDGAISRAGNDYVVGIRARDCHSGELIDAEQVQVTRKEEVLNGLSRIASKFRMHVGESRASMRNLDTPLAEATTPSLDALKSYSQAIRIFNQTGSAAAIPLFKHAIELDPNFAMAYVWLGRMYADFGEESPATENTTRAYQLRDRASEKEKFSIDTSYHLLVTGNLVKAREICQLWSQIYPLDALPHGFLSGFIYPSLGLHERGLEEAKKTLQLDPYFVVGYRNVVLNAIALNKIQEAEQALHQAAERNLFLPSFITDQYRLAFLKGDAQGMKHALDSAPSNAWLVQYDALSLARTGRLSAARDGFAKAIRLTQRTSRPETEAQLDVGGAMLELAYGNPDNAKKLALAALQLSKTRGVEYGAGYVLGTLGDSAHTTEIITDLNQKFPEDTVIQRVYLPQLMALVALSQGNPQKAQELLGDSSAYDMVRPMRLVYLRGQSFLAMGQTTQASSEFQKILAHPGLVFNDPVWTLARLQLARSYARAGEKKKAQVTYADLLQSMTDGDRTGPLIKQLKLESTRLQ